MNSPLRQYHYLYKITNLINNKIYIGIHSTNKLDDGYLGSGHALISALNKYGKENFKKEILEWFDWHCEALFRERIIVNAKFINSNDNYNLKIGGDQGSLGLRHSDVSKQLISQNTKLQFSNPKNKEKHSNITKALWINPLFRNKNISALKNSITEERKIKMSISAKNSFTDERKEHHSAFIKSKWKDPEYRKRITGIKKRCSAFGEICDSMGQCYIKYKEFNPSYKLTEKPFRRKLLRGEIKDCFVIDINIDK